MNQIASSSSGETQWSLEAISAISFSLVGFFALVLVLSTFLLWKSKASPDYVVKVFVVISVIATGAILLIAGYSNEQLTPIIGLFGAIVGYVLGKDSSQK